MIVHASTQVDSYTVTSPKAYLNYPYGSQFWVTVHHIVYLFILPADSVLLGLDSVRILTAALRFNRGNTMELLCIPRLSGASSRTNNDIACEPDIVGTVRLLNNSFIATTEPATATVRIRDDDCKQYRHVGNSQQVVAIKVSICN